MTMEDIGIFDSIPLVAILVIALIRPRGVEQADVVFWLSLVIALLCALVELSHLNKGGWQTGFSIALWLIIAASLGIFILVSLVRPNARKLQPLLMPYLVLLGVVALVWVRAPERPLAGFEPSSWLSVHIFTSILTYAMLTIAAVAGLAVVLQESALKRKTNVLFGLNLPAVADSETVQFRMLVLSEFVLGAGLVSGIGVQFISDGRFIDLDHKSLLSILTFVVIGALLYAHRRTGVRGRRAARYVLLAYLLLTLAYPGVKFVTDVLLV
jgi:ABC-type uncharacterized transport system permease subunit